MKKLSIHIYCNGGSYQSDVDEYTEDMEDSLKSNIAELVSGSLPYMQFKSGNKLLYFPSEMCKQSIISIIEH